MAPPRPSLVVPILLIVLVLVGAGVGTGLLFEYNHPKSQAPARLVAIGDNVTVNYIGFLASTPQLGRVFDTSLYAVATNNATYPKSLEFALRGSASQYTPLGVYVGPSGSYTINGVTFGSVVTGFWQGLLGLPVNHTAWITFPPSQGYGALNPSCLVTRPLTFTLPVLVDVPLSSFSQSYPGVNATPGAEFTDPTYGWTDLVFSANATAVVVDRLPTLGFALPNVGWSEVVTGVTASTITVANRLSPSDAGLVLGHAGSTGVCGNTQYIVSSVDVANGTYTENFNREVVGSSLMFEVTVVQFY